MKSLAVALALVTSTAVAQQQNLIMQMQSVCNTTETVESWIHDEYEEIGFVQSHGVFRRADGEFSEGVFKLYANPQTRTMTSVIEFPNDGLSCVVLMGNDMQPMVQGNEL